MGTSQLFTVGDQITVEDKAIVWAGALVFTSSPSASIDEPFHRVRTLWIVDTVLFANAHILLRCKLAQYIHNQLHYDCGET